MMEQHIVYITNENGSPTEGILAEVAPASQELVDLVLSKPVEDEGRSQFVWVRLQNGDLILGVYPQGDTYFEIEAGVVEDFQRG